MGRKVKQATPFAADGARLKAARLALGYKVLQHFADEAGIPSNLYSQHETGVRRITLQRARALKVRFSLPLDFIFDGNLSDSARNALPRDFESLYNEHLTKLENIQQHRTAA